MVYKLLEWFTADKVADKDYELHLQLLDEFIATCCIMEEGAVTPLSNFVGCYWIFVTKVKKVEWKYDLTSEPLIDAVYETARRKNYIVTGPVVKHNDDVTSFRTIFGLKLRPPPIPTCGEQRPLS